MTQEYNTHRVTLWSVMEKNCSFSKKKKMTIKISKHLGFLFNGWILKNRLWYRSQKDLSWMEHFTKSAKIPNWIFGMQDAVYKQVETLQIIKLLRCFIDTMVDFQILGDGRVWWWGCVLYHAMLLWYCIAALNKSACISNDIVLSTEVTRFCRYHEWNVSNWGFTTSVQAKINHFKTSIGEPNI